MSKSLGERINEASFQLSSMGYDHYGELLKDAYMYGSSSSEIYFKCSGILKTVLSDIDVNDQNFINDLEELKKDIDSCVN